MQRIHSATISRRPNVGLSKSSRERRDVPPNERCVLRKALNAERLGTKENDGPRNSSIPRVFKPLSPRPAHNAPTQNSYRSKRSRLLAHPRPRACTASWVPYPAEKQAELVAIRGTSRQKRRQ
ncbi:hypothetical protein PAXRUDRAFT_507388 [Paxillus rubicundulus Ve08.2h10]|uniref:Uncharacterized protein n=1 Tax=Paxillus rubicundulus Ve08.2h10 TaxID=930991 RepID=A0A0D0BUL2_9AGAM|nr:hypothetical protein PAXRUDRAFT_507388 [Paxillus rubicundulus Ve08.2h10]